MNFRGRKPLTMARVFQFSTQSGRSIPNATPALDASRPLAPIAATLAGIGLPDAGEGRGHAWGFSPESLVARAGQELGPGDIGLRIEPNLRTERLYEVLAFFPGRPDLPAQVNGRPWRSNGPPYPNVVIFRPFQSFTPRNFRDLVEKLSAPGAYVTGLRYEARYLPFDSDTLLDEVLPDHPQTDAPGGITVSGSRSRGQRLTAARDGGSVFRHEVFSAYRRSDNGRVECAACDLDDERVLEAAHVIDHGYAQDAWWNGIPLCRNHHRWFDLGVLRLEPATRAWVSPHGLAALRVTKTNLSVEARSPHPQALDWRWLNVAGPE
ncbi:HNH endonuclease [Actinoplanes sp. HUAS TT8]|uniref:HNH endonuclease n=1 Tax=Actinoplanes sp. HUAS TT8 TaxID=3447453 RepID=UPI003F51AC8E